MTARRAAKALTAARARLVSRLNRGIGLLAGRAGLTVVVKWDAQPHEPPAWYEPDTTEVTLNGPVALAGADPAEVNPTTPTGRRKHPILVGLLCHEGSHAHSTQWPADFLTGLPRALALAAQWLEEPRIERRQLQRRPGDRLYLRASSRLVTLAITGARSAAATRWQAAQALVLTAGRADAGVLAESEVRKVLTLCGRVLGRDDLAQLRELGRQALLLSDGDTEGLLAVARQWVEVVGEPEPGELPPPPCTVKHAGADRPTDESTSDAPDQDDAGQDESGQHEGEPNDPEHNDAGEDDRSDGAPAEQDARAAAQADALAAAYAAAMSRVGDSGVQEAADQLREDEAAVPQRACRTRQPDAEQEAAQQAAVLVFGGHGHTDDDDPGSPLGQPREPTAQERVLARRTGEALRRAQFRERGRVITPSAVPPGRLVGREAMQGAAQRARGVQVTALPFRQVIRRASPQPPLTVGIAVDVSGSMDWAAEIMSTTAWVLSHAVAQVGGRCATVAFGSEVTAVTHPGPPPRQVPTFVADDNWEQFTAAIRALDGGLALTSGSGARLVFVVSDGYYTDDEADSAARLVPRLVRHGVQVVWMDINRQNDYDYDDWSPTIVPAGALHMPVTDPADIPQQMRTVLVKALRAQ
jgi:VWA domain containing CoxE-like protein